MSQMIFKRVELKYIVTTQQYQMLKEEMKAHMSIDKYGKYSISNIYYDTDNFYLIRNSLEKPCYKEKLRVRSYGVATPDDLVFVELKKKFKGVVYKRRIDLTQQEVVNYLDNGQPLAKPSQISRELDYFMKNYDTIHPAVFLGYEREAYFGLEDNDFRMTFDHNICFREHDVTLTKGNYGKRVLEEGFVLLEVKCAGALPQWLINIFSEHSIFKTSFSKYGTAYTKFILPNMHCVTGDNGYNVYSEVELAI